MRLYSEEVALEDEELPGENEIHTSSAVDFDLSLLSREHPYILITITRFP